METHVEPYIDEIKMNDIELFVESVTGKRVYDSGDHATERVEVFLMCWLNGLDYPNKQQHIMTLYEQLRKDFPATGKLYRVMSFENQSHSPSAIKSMELTSYTDDIEIAKDILDKRDGWTRFIYITDASEGFDFHEMLMQVQKRTQSVEMEIVIMDREWEQEKLQPFVLEQNQLIWKDSN